jgi:23S rRNA (pseudouridine1915-N3)-methyltransferase
MRLIVAAVGRLKAGPERELAERYRERTAKIARALGFSGVEILEVAESRAARAPDRMAEEAAGLLKGTSEADVRVALDSQGRAMTSEGFAAQLGQWRDSGRASVIFMIGGADGLAPPLKQRANLSLAFGTATWPHQLVRIMLLEQLYRAATILSGHPYHRA